MQKGVEKRLQVQTAMWQVAEAHLEARECKRVLHQVVRQRPCLHAEPSVNM